MRNMEGTGLAVINLPLSIVIVTYNSADVLVGLLDSLAPALRNVPNVSIIVVDNDSTDDSTEIAEHHPVGVRVLRTGRNGGYAAAINAAAATVAPDAAILVLNPDIRLLPGSVSRLLQRAIEPDIGVVVPQMRDLDGTIAMSLRREPSLLRMWAHALLGPIRAARLGTGELIADAAAYRRSREVDWATGAALLITPQARARVGAWDESFFLYSEEVDYQRRVRTNGLRVVYEPSACVTHIGGAYMRSPMLAALMTRNQIRYFRRHHGRVETTLFRSAIIVFGLLRAWKSRTHRAVLRAAITPNSQ
ncbi:glycosyltransferase family 2 protein [Devosia sp. YIM 151766]|uniref:glycosyltransferase n=1 Tax=Devosia sp. YIM 151766 TaxID=3017325 RepID=UPI00255C6AC6|nr:glycosyltransferase family 2 protein [Devosia sp. YIM 151766]WIY54210.1 glycosyltransferase family 2 protein [Devosia sp. YIM 151766]